MGKATNVKFGRYISEGPCEQKPIKNLGENGVWAYTGKFFEYPLLSQERVKLQTSNFVSTFLVSIGTKAHYKFWEKYIAGCVVRTLETFQGTHILGASRGLLCDSSAVLSLHYAALSALRM